MISIIDLLDSGDYQIYNRSLARKFGSINAAIMLSELANRYKYHRDRNELVKFEKHPGEWFYYTHEKCTERTVMSRKEQDRAIKILEAYGIITKLAKGVPPRRHFKIDEDNLSALFLGRSSPTEVNSNNDYNLSERDKSTCPPICPKGTNPNVQKGQLPYIYKSPIEDPHQTEEEPPSACLSDNNKKSAEEEELPPDKPDSPPDPKPDIPSPPKPKPNSSAKSDKNKETVRFANERQDYKIEITGQDGYHQSITRDDLQLAAMHHCKGLTQREIQKILYLTWDDIKRIEQKPDDLLRYAIGILKNHVSKATCGKTTPKNTSQKSESYENFKKNSSSTKRSKGKFLELWKSMIPPEKDWSIGPHNPGTC